MALGKLFGRLFGSSSSGTDKAPSPPDRSQAVEYKGFTIIPAPRPHGSQYLTAALIEKELAGETRTHDLIRADTHASADDAKAFAIQKARQVIDEQGDRLFSAG
ncbi:hypothetical protein SAMN07250955_12058 [Arboricoccus pini]|uniref:Transcriptional activator HlyU n=1 Tax=Arboricoccus pini TaxID=1963835 RepID=A0A212S2A0_9PROT|nr:HlyU family transcriptional regulator [Arboricoccus pini]SNB79250.1 hypothetical protein SAMN07250955_12058 [Arboricoccus pini]